MNRTHHREISVDLNSIEHIIDDKQSDISTQSDKRELEIVRSYYKILSGRQLACFMMTIEQGYSQRKIAACLKIRRSSVRVHLNRAVYKIKKHLEADNG